MNHITIKITGKSPLLMHSDRFSDPLDPATIAHKQLTSKRKKTEQDQIDIARSEFVGAAYFDDENGFYLPGHMFKACMVGAGKLNKLGTHVKRSVLVLTDRAKLKHTGPKTPQALFDDPKFRDARSVVVSSARLMRYRPRFNQWEASFDVVYDDQQIDESSMMTILTNAGRLIGMGDYRVEKGGAFGMFDAEVAA